MFEMRDRLSIPEEKFYNIVIAVSEAVNNAITHGNKGDASKKIELEVEAEGSELKIAVTDEGKGFDPDALEDPRLPENLLKANGRGVFLMKELSDKAEFKNSEKGCSAILRFKL